MADRNGTLEADTLTEILVDSDDIEVLNLGPGELWASVDGGADFDVEDEDPKVQCIPAGCARIYRAAGSRTRIVRLRAAGTPRYSVSAL